MNSENISENEQLNQTKNKVDFNNVKSTFILRKITDNVKKNKFLNIIKYNKKIQKRLNLTIFDYKNYSSIEIELKLDDGKYGQFINISDDERENFHIYFDDSKKEITRN